MTEPRHLALAKLVAFNDKLRALLDRLRKRRKPPKPEKKPFGIQKPRHRPFGSVLHLPFGADNQQPVLVDQSRVPGGTGNNAPCPGPDKIGMRAHLECRARKGDEGARQALAALSGQDMKLIQQAVDRSNNA